MQKIMTGVRPACVGLIAGVIASLSLTNYVIDSAVNIPAIGIGILDLVLLLKWNVSIPKVIFLSAGLGIIFFGVLA